MKELIKEYDRLIERYDELIEQSGWVIVALLGGPLLAIGMMVGFLFLKP